MEIKELLKDYPEFEDETLIISSLEEDPNFKNAKSATDWAKKTYKNSSYVTRVGDLVLATHPYSVIEMLLNYDYYDLNNEISLGDRDYKELAKLSCHIFDKSDDASDNIHFVRTKDNTVDVFSNEDVCFKIPTGFDYQAAFVLTILYSNNKVIERLDESCVFELAGKINATLLDGEHEYTIYRNKITPMLVVLQNLEPVK